MHVGAQAAVVLDQLLLVCLDAGNVGADRNVAAVLGAALGDVQPAAVVELRLEGAGARRVHAGLLQAGAHLRHAADLDHGLIGGAGGHRGVRQLVQALEMRIAEHEAVFGVPQHESFRNGLDRVAQPEIGLHGLLGEALLFGDVDRDADQMQAAVGRGVAELAAHPQPDPVAVDVLHAEALVDVVESAGDHLVGDREQVDVVGFHQRVDFAEGEEVVAGVQPEHREHRCRPEDPAAREIPVPQAAAAAVERGVDPAAHRVVDEIALARPGRLPVEGEAEDQHDEARGGRQRHRQCGIRTPQRLVLFLDDDDLARQRLDQPRDRQRAVAVRQRHVADDALLAGGGEQLRRADDVEDAIAVAKAAFGRDAGQNPVIGAGDDDMAAARDAPGRHQVGQQALQPLDIGGAVLPDRAEAVEAFGQQLGERGEVALHRGALLPALVDHLDEGAETDGDEEGDDERRHGAAKRRLCDEQPVIGRFCDRLRQSLDRIGLDTCVRRMRARHALDPRRRLFCTLSGRNPASFRNHSDLNPVFSGCRVSTIR